MNDRNLRHLVFGITALLTVLNTASALASDALKPVLEVNHRGKYLELNCKLVDSAGQTSRLADPPQPPRFAVSNNDRQIGSGTFEYG